MSFKGLDDAGVPEPLFCDLAFSKPCIAVNGRKAVWDVSQDYSFLMVNQACFLSR